MGYLDKDGLSHLWEKITNYVAQNGGGTVDWENVNGRPDLSNVSTMRVVPVELSSVLWADNQQTVTVDGIQADEKAQLIIPIPAASSKALYNSSGIQAVSQAENAIAFQATAVPGENVYVNVYIFEVAEVGELLTGTFEWWSPGMTSYNTPAPYVVSPEKGTENSTNTGYIWCLFAGYDTKGMYIRRKDSGPSVQIDLGDTTYVRGISFRESVGYEMFLPKEFDFEGSNDGADWSLISRIIPDTSNAGTQEFMFDEMVKYRYYRLTNFLDYNNDASPNSNNAIIFNNLKFYKFTKGATS